MWTLIITLTLNTSVSVHSVSGFQTVGDCAKASTTYQMETRRVLMESHRTFDVNLSTVCVQQEAPK